MILAECANVLLSNLAEVDPSFIKQVIEDIDNCTISHYKGAFEEALKFFEENGWFPDKSFLSVHYAEVIETEVPFSDSIRQEFERLFRKEVATFKAYNMLQKGEIKEAATLLSEATQIAPSQTKQIGLDGIIMEYDRLSDEPSGLLTAVPEIDDLAKGCGYSTVTIIAAPPGHGKTTMAVSMAYMNSVKGGAKGAYLTLEVSERDWWYSLLSRHSQEIGTPLSAEKIKKGLLEKSERDTLERVRDDLEKNMKGQIRLFTVENFNNFSYTEMEHKFNQLELEWGKLDFIIVDYVQLFRFYRPPHMQPEEYCNNIVRFFGQYAIKANNGRGCVVVLLSQVNREGSKRIGKTERAEISCLAELNELERTAHLAIVLYSSESDRLSNQVGVSIVKNRTGLISEELRKAYADFDHFVIGSSTFSHIFDASLAQLLTKSGDGEDFFS
jgi:hypothetical protein